MGVLRRLAARMRGDGDLVVENTGEVTETGGGTAVTGYNGPPPRRGQGITVKNTGAATASGPGSRAVSGIDYT
ncbi:hypothetical protein SEA_KRADAL_89 [Streptomyces phage Kradal]|nr:hypothetical protein SEA_KRADAL_89 [Streptomyces phage Kradal]